MKASHKIHGQPSWRVRSRTVEAYLSQLAGHLGPVTFDRQGQKIRPYSVAPWAQEKVGTDQPTVVRVLRGDFFCMPFGGNEKPFRGERHPVHGETASGKWKFESSTRHGSRCCLHLSLKPKARKGRVDKRICLVDGHDAVYCQHVVSGGKGPMSYGHHAMLKYPDTPAGGYITTSRFLYGQTAPEPVEQPEGRGYSILKPNASFTSLRRVPTITNESTDLSRYPARRGFEDIAILVNDQKGPFAWTAAVFPEQRYVWFSLKDPRVLPYTLFWISNGGRHYCPWNGRHVNVIGLEEIMSYFHMGLAESVAPNPFRKKGYPTYVNLSPHRPLVVNYIMAMARVGGGFDRVRSIRPSGEGVVLRSDSGKQVVTAVDWKFLHAQSDQGDLGR